METEIFKLRITKTGSGFLDNDDNKNFKRMLKIAEKIVVSGFDFTTLEIGDLLELTVKRTKKNDTTMEGR